MSCGFHDHHHEGDVRYSGRVSIESRRWSRPDDVATLDGTRLCGMRGLADGRVAFERLASSGDRIGNYPAVARTPDGVMLAWTTGDPAASTIRVESIK